MLVTMKEILDEAYKNNYAVGAFDTLGHVFVEGILNAAEKAGTPVILMVIENVFEDEHCDRYFSYLVNRCRMSSVPVALHLDHGHSIDNVIKAIHCGCTSVMLDASNYPLEKNITMTKEVVRIAHACGVTVESEIGHVAGHEGNMFDGNVADESAFTKVEDAAYFVRETGIDALAVAIGTVHGVYKGEPHIDYDRLDSIKKVLNIPVVLHGGSGMTPEIYREVVRHGVNKINFFTALTLAATRASRGFLAEHEGNVPFESVIDAGQQAIEDIVSKHIEIFGTPKAK